MTHIALDHPPIEDQNLHPFYERVLEPHAQDCPFCHRYLPSYLTVQRVGVFTGYNADLVYEYRKCKQCSRYVYQSGATWKEGGN